MKKNNIAAIYIRVSTDSQTEFSPDAQLKAIKNYARSHNYEIDSRYIFKDEGISGRKAEKRPGFMKMIALAKSKPSSPFSTILVHKFDRFARNREDSVVYKSLLRKECNVDVISITEDFGDDKFSVILEAMLEAMAEYYSLNLSDEVLKGMTEKAHRGEYQTKAPFGYNLVNKALVINNEESPIIKKLFESFNLGTPLRTLAFNLNSYGIKTKRGNLWEVRTVEYVLRNPIYVGDTVWTPGRKSSYNFKERDLDGIYIKETHPPIVSRDLFDAVQLKIQKNKELYKYSKEKRGNDWIRRLVKCSNCGSTLSMSSKGYLQCSAYSHGSCRESHSIAIKTIKTAILNQIKKDFTDPININLKISQKDNTSDADVLKDLIKKCNEKLERCKNLYIEGIDTIDEYKTNKEALEHEKKAIEDKLSGINVNIPSAKEELSTFKIKAQNVYEVLVDDKIDEDVKYAIIHELIEKIIFYKDSYTIEIFYKL